ncbi:aromatic acid/H+ symport family MFS transporter [Actinomadura sp. B10D3]|uniref:MFS transporter n=1 Tax=Actinomadura sp. B10D3 TaxID=3153557 RepID=UPI00325E7379
MSPPPARIARRTELTVMSLCFAVIVFDGYDLIVYGATLPGLLEYQDWGLTKTEAGAIGSYALIGMLAGALVAGAVTDLIGRRRVLMIGVGWFSVAMIGCALAPGPGWFGLCRLLAGLGLGGVMPTAVALTAEYSRADRRSLNNAIMFSGYSVGGVLAAVLTMKLMPEHGFRVMYWTGAAPLLLVPVLWRLLPESASFLAARGRHATGARAGARPGTAAGTSRRHLAELFERRHLTPALLFALTSFLGLLLVYGLNTWLPQIMKSAGYPLSGSLLFLVVMNAGAVFGTILVAPLGDRLGMKPVTASAFLTAAVSITLLSQTTAKPVMYALVAVAGFGTVGTQIMVNAYVAMHFPAQVRATALGWTLGIGRLGAILGPTFGGYLLAADVDVSWNFYAFAIPAAAGAALVLFLPAREKAAVPAETGVKMPA